MPLESVARGAEFDRVRLIYGARGIYGALWPGGGGFGDLLDCKSLGVSPNSTAATMGSAPKTSIMMTIFHRCWHISGSRRTVPEKSDVGCDQRHSSQSCHMP